MKIDSIKINILQFYKIASAQLQKGVTVFARNDNDQLKIKFTSVKKGVLFFSCSRFPVALK